MLHFKLLKVGLASSVANQLQCALRAHKFVVYVIDNVTTQCFFGGVHDVHLNTTLSLFFLVCISEKYCDDSRKRFKV